jgi:hypothetical protein
MVNLSAIAFAVRQALAAQGHQLSAGHAQQLVSAALGHNNLASYQSSGDDPGLDEAHDIVIDTERLGKRAADLGHVEVELAKPIFEVLRARYDDATVYRNLESYLIALQEFVDVQAPLNDAVNSEVAMTNGTLPMANLEMPLWNDFDAESSDDIHAEFSGLVTVSQDEDRVYWGHEVEVDAILDVERFGRMLFGARQLTVGRAQLRWMGEGSDTEE